VLANVDGFWTRFLGLLDHMRQEGFIRAETAVDVMVAERPDEIVWSWRRDRGVKLAGYPAGDGGKKRRSPGRARISRKTIARGKPGCPGCTCSLKPVCFLSLLSHMGLRAQSAPGFPCALCSGGSDEFAKLRRNRAVRMRAVG